MEESCATCSKRLRLIKSDYANHCEETEMDGYACLALAHEGVVYWMVGNKPEDDMCEAWEEATFE